MSLPIDPQTLPIAATGFPAPIERHWDTLCRNNLGQLVDGNGVALAIPAVQLSGQMVQAVWTAATLTNSWVNFGSGIAVAAYRFDLPSKRVNIKGFVGGGAANTVMFTLPAAMWPAEQRVFCGPTYNGVAYTSSVFPFAVGATGLVTALAAVAVGSYAGIECSFQI